MSTVIIVHEYLVSLELTTCQQRHSLFMIYDMLLKITCIKITMSIYVQNTELQQNIYIG